MAQVNLQALIIPCSLQPGDAARMSEEVVIYAPIVQARQLRRPFYDLQSSKSGESE
jgi:hypothetical protein